MTNAHDSAVERLRAGVAEQDRLRDRYSSAIGTSSEFGAYMQLQAAGEQVVAREAWLHWVDDDGFPGLNAGSVGLPPEPGPPEAAEAHPARTQDA